MEKIGNNKPKLLEQIKTVKPGIEQIDQLFDRYEDLTLNDLYGFISDEMYTILSDRRRDPYEKDAWEQFQNLSFEQPCFTLNEVIDALTQINVVIRNLNTYILRYPQSPKINEANALQSKFFSKKVELEDLKRSFEGIEIEKRDWELLDKKNYTALRNYLIKYPNSIHREEIDDLMWTLTKNAPRLCNFQRYLDDHPEGRHAQEAYDAINEFPVWENVKRSKDIFLVDDYRDNYPNSPFKSEINALYFDLRDETLKKMEENPAEFKYEDVIKLIQADIFNHYDLIDQGLMTEDSWETLQNKDRVKDSLPKLEDFVINSVEGTAPNATDVFLFGVPGTGKTCMLMGLVGADGTSFDINNTSLTYSLNLKKFGGDYAAALSEFVKKGITPGTTAGSFVTTFHGEILEEVKKGQILEHRINLVEMSGEEFARHIADNENAEVSFEHMGTGATKVMSSENRKIFFIIVDPTRDQVKFTYEENIYDDNGNITDSKTRVRYINQSTILAKFVSLFELPENQQIMKRVDAIHFIATKSDALDKQGARGEVAVNILKTKYPNSVTKLKTYCRRSRRINRTTNYEPALFTFSLGKFYLGDIFKFDPSETHQILNAIQAISFGRKEITLLDRLKDIFG